MRDPSFSILYGNLKIGKTADALAAFPGAVYIAAPGALASAESLWGFPQPKAYDLATFRDVREFCEKSIPNGAPAVVVDDATLIADRTINVLKAKGFDGFGLWGAIFTSAVMLRDSLRRRGLHVAFTCHPMAAEVKDGVRLLGGPAFPGQVRSKLPAAADLLLRAEPRPAGEGFGWPAVYRTALHPDWLQGSRYNTPDAVPMDLREILNAAGFKIPRLKGLEWQDEAAAAVAAKLSEPGILGDKAKARAVLEYAADFIGKKWSKDERHTMWALHDGYSRAVIQAAVLASRRGAWGF